MIDIDFTLFTCEYTRDSLT